MAGKQVPNLKIALVDDDRDLRMTLVKGLMKFGITAHPFASGPDFLEALSYLDPDCVLLDLRMPEMDGIEVLSLIPAKKRHIPIILFTSHGDIPTAVEAIKQGAQDFLEKPMRLQDIDAKVRSVADLTLERKEQSRKAIQARHLLETLSPREEQVIRMVCEGMRSLDIAENLDLSVRTVEIHRRNASKKLGTNRIAKIVNLIKDANFL